MFETTVREQGDAQQREYWLPKIRAWEAIGCYAQTELGHGSNVKGLECRATWDPKTREFVLHSPTLTASKWWNGTMGRTANHAIVVAQLYVPESTMGGEESRLVNRGPHPFIVQIRDLKTHLPLEGIIVGDIGPKYGYAPMDNGFVSFSLLPLHTYLTLCRESTCAFVDYYNRYMLFNNFRIPHSAMLSNYSRVDPNTGTYSKPANPAVVYGSLTYVRAVIIMHARLIIARAVTIAVRYSTVRKQFPDRDSNKEDQQQQSAPELSVLDYPTVQIRILPLLATAFALHFTGEAMHTLYSRTRAEIAQGDFSKLAILHAQSSGLKSLCTELAANSIETCRRAMGGHGFMYSSGFVQLNNDYLSKPTVEGDNWMITQQTARFLIKRMEAAVARKGPAKDSIEQDCRDWLDVFHNNNNNAHDQQQPQPHPPPPCEIFLNDNQIVQAFRRRSRHLTYNAYISHKQHKRPWNSLLLQLRKISIAESESILISNFHDALAKKSPPLSPLLKTHLTNQFHLFAFTTIESSAREFVSSDSISDANLNLLSDKIQDLMMKKIRPHAVRLVDAWKIPDYLLDSALGRFDGKVYEDLFDRAHKRNPLNEMTFNPDYRSEEIVMGDGGDGIKEILAKL